MLRAMDFGQQAIAKFCEAQQRFLDRCDITPVEWPIHVADPSIDERISPFFDEMSQALSDADKQARMGKVEELKARIKEESFNEEELSAWGSDIAAALKALEKKAMRAMVIETGERADGRFPAPRSACSTSGSVLTPSTRPRASAICTSTTSRRTAPVKRAVWALRSAARSATVRLPSAPCFR